MTDKITLNLGDLSPSEPKDPPSNVVDFPGPTCAYVPPKKVLAGLMGEDLEEIVVVARGKDGTMFHASSSGYLPDIHWFLTQAIRHIYELSDEGEEPPSCSAG